jgi:hypothetical protein
MIFASASIQIDAVQPNCVPRKPNSIRFSQTTPTERVTMKTVRFFLAITLASISFNLLPQNATTSLRGIVTDSNGASIVTATVTLTNREVGYEATAKVDAEGQYSFQELAPGRYAITVQAVGFADQAITAELLVAQPATVNVTMGVTAVTTVDVSGAAETINTTDATIGNAINNETIMELPSEGRNPQTLLAL